jgi:hypothetical protein
MDDTTVSAIGLNNDLSHKPKKERDPHPDSQTASEYGIIFLSSNIALTMEP